MFRFFLRHTSYTRLWLGQCLSTLGDVLYNAAVVWFLVTSTGSALAGSGIAIGAILGGGSGGAVAAVTLHRRHPRTVMLGADAVRFLSTGLVAAAWLGGWTPTPLVLYALAAVVSFCTTFFQPARLAATPSLVPQAELVRAGAAEGLGGGLVAAGSWAVSGFLVAVLGIPTILLIDALTFLASLALVALTRWVPEDGGPVADRADLARGWRWLRRDRTTSWLVGLEFLHALFTGLVYATVPLFVLTIGGGAHLFGVQGGLSALAMLVASLVIGRRAPTALGRMYVLGIAVNAVGTLVMALAPGAVTFLLGIVVAGLGAPAWTTARQVIVQAGVPHTVRGSVFAWLETAIHLALLPTWSGGAWLADLLGARTVMFVAPVGYVLVLSLALRAGLPRHRVAAEREPVPG